MAKLKKSTAVKECKQLDDGTWFVVVEIDGREYSDRMLPESAEEYLRTLDKKSKAYKFFSTALNEIKKKGAQDASESDQAG